MTNRILLFLVVFFFIQKHSAQNNPLPQFEVFTKSIKASILYEGKTTLDSIVAYSLAEDIFRVTGFKPLVTQNKNKVLGNVIVIGQLQSALVQSFLGKKNALKGFEKQWESYGYKTILKPNKKIAKAFVIAGTNPRGTAYGVFDLSQKMGVSPWYWWADVPTVKQKELVFSQDDFLSKEPSVKFRGIFLNDEDWGLRPWASKTFEPEVGNIGPKTYAKIFELLLRLKANTIWPAMHEGTTAFFKIPGNNKIAADYQIVVGSSHAEPMLRNNVDEWKEKEMGHFNYVTNKDNVYQYWEDRIKESKGVDAIYTIGMRGVHDSGMEGVKTKKEGAKLLTHVIEDQRNLLKKYINPNVSKVPQAFTIYKEVLDLYDEGLEVPDDITLVWTDDNYGYIRRLSNEEEQKRSGGGGVYYHASYWGRPHDYLWLSTTHPALIREEMMKAYEANCATIWILNVGDIKPCEYNMQLFMDMAYEAESFKNPNHVKTHMDQFYSSVFGKKYGKSISDLNWDYFDLAFERKPEFMGWSQTEPSTKTQQTAYNPFFFGDENQTRISKYQDLEDQVTSLKDKLSKEAQDAYFQLVYYPVKAASLMNKKFLYADKATIYGKLGRLDANNYAKKSEEAFEEIESLTQEYNQLGNGKWNHMMSRNPRNLPVFDKAISTIPNFQSSVNVGVMAENESASVPGNSVLPSFYQNSATTHFVDLFLMKATTVNWEIKSLSEWLNVSKKSGVLDSTSNQSERIEISIDWKKWNQHPVSKTAFVIQYGNQSKTIDCTVVSDSEITSKNSFVARDNSVVIYAQHFSKQVNNEENYWKKVAGLGYSKTVMEATPLFSEAINVENLPAESAYLEYQISIDTAVEIKNPELFLHVIPTHPITEKHGVQVGVQWNDEPIQIVDFKTFHRSQEWKQNVLSNSASREIKIQEVTKGANTLRIYAIDGGVLLDYIYIKLNKNNPVPYSLLPETIK